LIFFCAKMGAGKSTKSKELALENNAVLLSEDEWLSILYPKQISSFDDHIKYSALLRPLIKSLIQKILLRRCALRQFYDFRYKQVFLKIKSNYYFLEDFFSF